MSDNIKTCSKCQQNKPFSEFHKERKNKDGLKSSCKICTRVSSLSYYTANKATCIAKTSEYQRKHAQERSDYCRQWRKENAEHLRIAKAKDFQKNKAHRQALNRQWIAAHPDRANEYSTEWRKRHPEKRRISAKSCALRRKKAPGQCTPAQWLAKIDFWGWRCYLCGCQLTSKTMHVDHRIPLSKGGTHWPANLAPACAKCNLRKNNKTEREFRRMLGEAPVSRMNRSGRQRPASLPISP